MDGSLIFPKKILQKCPVCEADYDAKKVQLLDAQDLDILSYFKCDNCKSGIALKIMIMPHGVVGQAIVTDLEPSEILNFKSKKILVNSTDVLCVYDFFKKKKDLLREIK